MNTIIASVFLGLTIIGSAFAVPNSEDRRKLCESKPNEYVWVEKTEACIPINPCKQPTNSDIYYVYCMWESRFSVPKDNVELRDLLINTYVEKTLETSVSKIVQIDEDIMTSYVCVNTTNGDYFCHGLSDSDMFDVCGNVLETAFMAYGADINGFSADSDSLSYAAKTKYSCADIGAFAEAISGKTIKSDTTRGMCVLSCSRKQ